MALLSEVDWIEGWNARLVAPGGNQRAAELAVSRNLHLLPRVMRTLLEIGGAATIMTGDLSTAAGFHSALHGDLTRITGRGALVARLFTPIAKMVNATRGNRRVKPGVTFGER